MEDARWQGVLIPELLLGMVGCGGGAFVWVGDGEDALLMLSNDVEDVISGSEREQLNRLVKLGTYYHMLSGYSCKEGLPYHAAVGQAIVEVLDVYRGAVLQVEECYYYRKRSQEAHDDTSMLYALEQALEEFYELFPFLVQSIETIDGADSGSGDVIFGVDIIHIFEKAARGSGVPIIEGCSLRILWHCYQVLFKQMYSWMVYGRLVDPSNDFFIHADNKDESSVELVSSRLPGVISLSVARDVLYIGQYVRMLDSFLSVAKKHSYSAALEEYSIHSDFGMLLKDMFFPRENQERFDWIAFKNIVHEHKVNLSSMVWKEMYSPAWDLNGQVDEFTDIVLQNRGALYCELIPACEAVFCISGKHECPDSARSQLATHVFEQAMFSIASEAADDRKSSVKYSMVWYDVENPKCILPMWHPSFCEGLYVPSYDAWDGICIRCDMQWPLEVLFPVDTMRIYGSLWQLMFRLTRSLQQMKTLRFSGQSINLTRSGNGLGQRRLMALHHQLHHLLSTYAMYLQSEIVSDSRSAIRQIIASSSSLIDAESKHRQYLADIVQISCVDVRQIMGVLGSMFAIVRTLRDSNGLENDEEKMNELYDHFLAKYNVFYQLLQSNQLQAGKRGEAIRRLVLKLNYNGFLDLNAQKQLSAHELYIS